MESKFGPETQDVPTDELVVDRPEYGIGDNGAVPLVVEDGTGTMEVVTDAGDIVTYLGVHAEACVAGGRE